MAKTNYQDIDSYEQAFEGEALARLRKIRQILREVVPEAEECISYQIPCFKYQGYLLYYCAFPRHISLSYPFSQTFWEAFKEELQTYKTSKSAIQLPANRDLPENLIRNIAEFRKKENEAKAALKKK